jgi:Domain of unknown function (DUF397)
MDRCGQTMNDDIFPAATWRSAGLCGPNGGNCVEVNLGVPRRVGVRDSKSGDGLVLVFGREKWVAFLDTTKSGRFTGE